MSNRISLRKAIDQHCKSCIHDPIGGSGAWRQQVEACTSTKCGLFNVRPKSKANGVKTNTVEER